MKVTVTSGASLKPYINNLSIILYFHYSLKPFQRCNYFDRITVCEVLES